MASSGPNSPGTMADDATVGTVAWSNPDNAKVEDGAYAICGIASIVTYHYLKATNFGFSIPTGATINGIKIEIKQYETDGSVTDNVVKIVKADGTYGTENKAIGGGWVDGVNAYVTYGGVSDLWSETWTAEDINDADFGVGISVIAGAYSAGYLDHIRITVYYTETSGTRLVAAGRAVASGRAVATGRLTAGTRRLI